MPSARAQLNTIKSFFVVLEGERDRRTILKSDDEIPLQFLVPKLTLNIYKIKLTIGILGKKVREEVVNDSINVLLVNALVKLIKNIPILTILNESIVLLCHIICDGNFILNSVCLQKVHNIRFCSILNKVIVSATSAHDEFVIVFIILPASGDWGSN